LSEVVELTGAEASCAEAMVARKAQAAPESVSAVRDENFLLFNPTAKFPL
jgi:hypothetical protein